MQWRKCYTGTTGRVLKYHGLRWSVKGQHSLECLLNLRVLLWCHHRYPHSHPKRAARIGATSCPVYAGQTTFAAASQPLVRLRVDPLTDEEVWLSFRFRCEHIPLLCKGLEIYSRVVTEGGISAANIEVIWILLRFLAYPERRVKTYYRKFASLLDIVFRNTTLDVESK